MASLACVPRFLLIALLLGACWPGALLAAEEGVVRIEATVKGKLRFGSGFVVRIEGDAAYVATAAHVVEGDPNPRLFFRGRPHNPTTAQVIDQEGGDPNGLALLRVESGLPAGLKALPMAEGGGTDLKLGQAVTAIGIPASIRNWAVLSGAVASWKQRNILFSGGVDEGNSGGPLLAGAAVVGIVMHRHGGEGNFGFAVPAASLNMFLASNTVVWAGAASSQITAKGTVPKAGEPFRDCPTCPEMVVIPAGSFQMGSPPAGEGEEGRTKDEGPVHPVQIARPFALAKHEVTVGEFGAFVQATVYRTEAEKGQGCAAWDGTTWAYDAQRNWRAPGFTQGDDHPVVCVSWNDAKAYLNWLSKESGQAYRLPSEAQWEYATRAGSTSARFWGKNEDQACAYGNVADKAAKRQHPNWPVHNCDDGFLNTAPVGSFKANTFGLEDMLGNVREWTEDCWNGSYVGAPSDGSAWTKGECGRRVLRGGSWNITPVIVRSADRSWDFTGGRDINSGFRPARNL